MAWGLKLPIAIVVLALAFCAGVCVRPVEFGAQAAMAVEPTVRCQLVERCTVQYVDRPVAVAESIERVQGIPAELRDFSDLEELRQWLIAVDANITTVYFQLPDAIVDCDDYALGLQRKAFADGYIVSFEIIGRGEYATLFKSDLPPGQSLHAINLAIIGNNAYYIEPQTNEVVLAAYLD